MRETKYFILSTILVVFMSISLNGVIAVNHLEEVFPEPPTGESALQKITNSVSELIIDATSFLIRSHSSANLLLNEMEKSEKGYFDSFSSTIYINDAIRLLKLSRENYFSVIERVKDLDYIEEKINCLKTFDYIKYAKDHNLIIEIMEQVEEYFLKGDVKGFYWKNLENIDSILSLFYSIRYQLNSGIKPEIQLYWQLLRLYSNTMLFGNYATASAKEAFSREY